MTFANSVALNVMTVMLLDKVKSASNARTAIRNRELKVNSLINFKICFKSLGKRLSKNPETQSRLIAKNFSVRSTLIKRSSSLIERVKPFVVVIVYLSMRSQKIPLKDAPIKISFSK